MPVEVSVAVCRMLAPGLFSVPVGLLVSRCQVHVAGVASVLPAASVARTSKVWSLSVSPATLCGLVQDANDPPSMLHSNVEPGSLESNVKDGTARLDGSEGLVRIVVLGAVRSGISRIIVPKENEADLDDLPKEVREKLEIFLVQELGEVLALTLRGASFREGRLLFGEESPRDVQPLSAGYH